MSIKLAQAKVDLNNNLELLNRLMEVGVYNNLNPDSLNMVIHYMTSQVNKNLKEVLDNTAG